MFSFRNFSLCSSNLQIITVQILCQIGVLRSCVKKGLKKLLCHKGFSQKSLTNAAPASYAQRLYALASLVYGFIIAFISAALPNLAPLLSSTNM